MDALVYSFDTSEAPKITEVGGKAKALIDSTRAGLPVPEGIVLSVSFFEPWLESIKESDLWKEWLSEPTIERCEALQEKARGSRFSQVQLRELDKYLKALDTDNLYAVRSSAPEEDMEGVSFAGMYESFLGLKRADLEGLIKRVFLSMFDYRVIAYKTQKACRLKDTCMAVIVQKQISSDVSGVGFSLNPYNNCYDEAVINGSFGLGEAIVRGSVTPDSYTVDKVKQVILEKAVNEKKSGLWLDDQGGTLTRDNEEPWTQALRDHQIFEVTKLIARCESLYARPVDIEWAYGGEKLYLLQARPITTYIPLFPELLTKPGERKRLYIDAMGSSQGFDEPLSVLGLDIYALVMARIMDRGIMPAEEGGYLINLHGKQYLDVSNILKGMGNRIGMQTVGEQDYVLKDRKDEVIPEYRALKKTAAMRRSKRAIVKVAFSTIPTMLAVFVHPRKHKDLYEQLVAKAIGDISKLESNKPFDHLVNEGFELLKDITHKAVTYVPGEIALGSIKRMFKHRGLEDEIAAIRIDLSSNPTSDMGRRQFQLACEPEIKATATPQEFVEKITSRGYSKAFMEKYDQYMSLYGDRGFKEIDIANPRLRSHPDKLYLQLSHINTQDSQMTRAIEKKEVAYKRLRDEAAKLGKTKKFEKNAERYENLFGFRETPKYLAVVLIGRLREIALEVGDELARKNRLERGDQIFNLHLDEIAQAQKDQKLNLLALIKKNLDPYETMKLVREWPVNIDSRGKVFYPKPSGKEGEWTGQVISRGFVSGKAKVLSSPYEKPLVPGDILVIHSAEPAWTPVFLNASGVVLEVGGVLQHGAIIACEYGIPCVSGIREATQRIEDGDLIEVDGRKGTVRIIG